VERAEGADGDALSSKPRIAMIVHPVGTWSEATQAVREASGRNEQLQFAAATQTVSLYREPCLARVLWGAPQ